MEEQGEQQPRDAEEEPRRGRSPRDQTDPHGEHDVGREPVELPGVREPEVREPCDDEGEGGDAPGQSVWSVGERLKEPVPRPYGLRGGVERIGSYGGHRVVDVLGVGSGVLF